MAQKTDSHPAAAAARASRAVEWLHGGAEPVAVPAGQLVEQALTEAAELARGHRHLAGGIGAVERVDATMAMNPQRLDQGRNEAQRPIARPQADRAALGCAS